MSSATTETVVKMLESLPEALQERTMEHLREYVEEMREEERWEQSFSATQDRLVAAARRARGEIAEGKAVPVDLDAQ